MRSYWDHLAAIEKKQSHHTFRSSALFPLCLEEGDQARLLFMNYWMVKRSIHRIGWLTSLRDRQGALLSSHFQLLAHPKCHQVEIRKLLSQLGLSFPFIGSVEVEFFSAEPMVFPFPAVTIHYYNKSFSSMVHAAERVYNDVEDRLANYSERSVECGFNLYGDAHSAPWVALTNGPEGVQECRITLTRIACDQPEEQRHLSLGELPPYATRQLLLDEFFPPRNRDGDSIGCCKIALSLPWIFPRLLVGNLAPIKEGESSSEVRTLTHSYYDCSEQRATSNYWLPPDFAWHPAQLMLPIPACKQVRVTFYPIYSPSTFYIDVELYDRLGNCIALLEKVLEVDSLPSNEKADERRATKKRIVQIDLRRLADQVNQKKEALAARLIAYPKDGRTPLPARIKVGYDLGDCPAIDIPSCNICLNFQPFNPALEGKVRSFRWCPFLADEPNPSIWILNSSPAKSYTTTAKLTFTWYREKDDLSLTEVQELPPHSFLVFDRTTITQAVSDFLQETVGWLTVSSSTPHVTTFYFSRCNNGFIGGDHGY